MTGTDKIPTDIRRWRICLLRIHSSQVRARLSGHEISIVERHDATNILLIPHAKILPATVQIIREGNE